MTLYAMFARSRLDMLAPCRRPDHPDIARNKVGEGHERHLIPEDCIRADIRPPEAASGLQQSLAPILEFAKLSYVETGTAQTQEPQIPLMPLTLSRTLANLSGRSGRP